MPMAKSILQDEKKCWFCHSQAGLHEHHIYAGTARRKISEENGFKVYLCWFHHNGSAYGVHFNRVNDLLLKRACQRKYEETGSREDFIKLVGLSYL